jgi:hypothetical protein
MKKDTVMVHLDNKQCSGYNYLIPPGSITTTGLLDALVKWSEGKPGVTIFSHSLRREEINFDHYENEFYTTQTHNIKVPYCDWVYYLDIWYQ